MNLLIPTDSFLEKLVQKYPLPRSDIKAPLLLSACNDNVVEGKALFHPRFMILHRVGLAGGALARTGHEELSE